MLTAKNRVPRQPPSLPIREELVPVRTIIETQEFRTQCLRCGALVVMKTVRTVGDNRYVTCPACGAQHCQYLSDQRHRLTR